MSTNQLLSEPARLDVFIRGSRNYVQGSQVLSRSFEILRPTAEFSPRPVLISAKFESVTQQSVWMARQLRPEQADNQIGSSVFRVGDKPVQLYYYADPSSGARHIGDKPNPIVEFDNRSVIPEKPEGFATFSSNATAESLLEGVIAVVKRLHQDIDRNVVDVWFTALARASIEDRAPSAEFAVEMQVEHRMRRMVGERVQTLSSVTLNTSEIGIVPTFQIAFSYRSANEN